MARTRVAAARAVLQVWQDRVSMNEALPAALQDIPARDKGLLQALVYQTIRHFQELEALANSALTKPLRKKDLDVYCLLLVGICQVRFLSIPDHAAVASTVDAAKLLKKDWARGLLNAVLRKATVGHLQAQFKEPARWNHPQWMLDMLRTAWPNDWQSIVQANQEPGPLTLRLNLTKQSRIDYLAELASWDIAAQPTQVSPYGITLDKATDVTALPGFTEGRVSVQDEAAQMAAHWLDPQPGQRILDACAAPGGKTGHILELIQGNGDVIAVDQDSRRLVRIEENLTRIGLNAVLHCASAEDIDAYWNHKPFDRILLDVPCSGTGVIRRHPDIKLLRRPEDIAQLVKTQRRILDAVWPMLKPGGFLLYTTCSVLPAENEEQVSAFLARTPDAAAAALPASRGLPLKIGQQWLPLKGGSDGFYYARLQKLQS